MRWLRCRLARLLGGRRPALQAGAVCTDPATGHVLMITSRDTGRWVIPKGWPMPGRTLAEAALQEAWEEAGVRAAAARELGRFHYNKAQARGFAIPVEVQAFLVSVEALADEWPERRSRARRWFPPAEAAALVAEPELGALLKAMAAQPPAGPPARMAGA